MVRSGLCVLWLFAHRHVFRPFALPLRFAERPCVVPTRQIGLIVVLSNNRCQCCGQDCGGFKADCVANVNGGFCINTCFHVDNGAWCSAVRPSCTLLIDRHLTDKHDSIGHTDSVAYTSANTTSNSRTIRRCMCSMCKFRCNWINTILSLLFK